MEVLGKPAFVRKTYRFKKLVASMDLGIIRPLEKGTTSFFYYLTKSEGFQNHIQGYANGTTVLHLSSKGVPEYFLALPPKQLIERFCSIANILLAKVEANWLEIEILTDLRDALLPKLMSGKIRVPVQKEGAYR